MRCASLGVSCARRSGAGARRDARRELQPVLRERGGPALSLAQPKAPMNTFRSGPAQLFDPLEAAIQHVAHFLWLEEGRPAGRDLDLWLRAREILRHRATLAAPPPDDRRSAEPLAVDPL